MAAYLSANSVFAMIIEATRGTTPATGTPAFIPVGTPQVSPMLTFLHDEALRGSPALVYDGVQGVRHDEFDAKFNLYADTFPNLLVAVLGSTDTVTGAGPYVHTIGLLNAATTGSQPPSYSLMSFDGANYFILPGSQAASLDIAAGVETAAEATVKFICNAYHDSTTIPAPFSTVSYANTPLIPSWNTTVSVGGTGLTYISHVELKIDRKTAPIFTMGQESSFENFAGPIDVTGKFTAVVNSNADPFSISTSTGMALVRDQVPVVLTFTDPNSSTSATNWAIKFTMTQTQFETPKRNVGKQYTEVEVAFFAEANSTDAISGYSPVKTVTTNNSATAYH